MKTACLMAAWIILLCVAGQAPAAEAAPALLDAHAAAVDAEPHPQMPQSAPWPGVVLIVILGMFAAAAIVGPVVRLNMPEELPITHAHDEPPGTSHHHGASGADDNHGGHGH